MLHVTSRSGSLLLSRARILVAFAVLAFPTLAIADLVHLKSGKKIEGKITSDGGDTLEIETKFGPMKISRSDIAKIERIQLPKDELKQMVEDAGEDAVLLWRTVEFAKKNKLTREVKAILEKVIKADPQHIEANKELGRIYYNGHWYSPEELDAAKTAEAEKMKAAGKVFHDGQWMKEETVKKIQGYELYKGEWLKWKDIYLLEAAEKMEGFLGVTLEGVPSEHFILWSELDPVAQSEILSVLETGFQHFVAVFQPTDVELNMMTFYPTAVYVLPSSDLVATFAQDNGYMVSLYNPPKDINSRYLDATSFPVFFPRPLIVTSSGRHLKGGGDKATSLIGFLSHYSANVMLRRFKRGGKIAGWVESGVTHYYEGMLNGYRTLSIDEYTGFEHVEKWVMGLSDFKEWYTKIADPSFRSTLPRLASFKGKFAEELTGQELFKAYFMVRWLLESEERAPTFIEYVRMAYNDPNKINVTIPEDEAFQRTFGVNPEVLEEEFEFWASRLPSTPPMDG